MIDVVINCYNDQKCLPDAVNSVLTQSAFHLINTIFIMDDGSTDNTRELCKTFESEKICYLYQENQGLAAARNFAQSHSKSQFIAFLDSDDIWHPDKLKIQSQILLANSDISLIYSNVFAFYDIWPAKKIEKFRAKKLHGTTELENYFLYDAPIFPSTVIVKNKIYNELNGFDANMKKSEDTEFFIRFMAHHNFIAHCDEYLVYRRLSQNSLGGDMENLLPYQFAIESKAIQQTPALKRLISKRHAYMYFVSAKEKLIKFADKKKARHFLLKSLRLNPKNGEAIGLYLFSYIPLVSNPKLALKIKILYKNLSGKYT